jgi:hypothetical protein
MNGPRALITAALSIALLATAASSASAASTTPASADFGRVLLHRQSAPITFTVTKTTETRLTLINPGLSDVFVASFSPGGGFLFLATTCPRSESGFYYLDATTPSCTITASFKPAVPGPSEGGVLWHIISARALLTGTGLLPAKNFYCRKKHGKFVSHKGITKYCVNRKK